MRVLDEIARQRPEALMVDQDNVCWLTRSKIAQSMSRYKIPAIHAFKEAVADGTVTDLRTWGAHERIAVKRT